MQSKQVLEQTSCPHPDCSSSDAFTVYLQGDGTKNATCFSCGRYFHSVIDDEALYRQRNGEVLICSRGSNQHRLAKQSRLVTRDASMTVGSIEEALSHPIREIKERCISYTTAERYGVRVGVDNRDGVTPTYYLFPVYKEGSLSGFNQKILEPKSYLSIGDCSHADLFGIHVIPSKGKKLFITEGPEDCLSVYQVLKENSSVQWEPAVIALGGAEAKINRLLAHQDILDSYEEIVLCLDSDAAGKSAAKRIAKLLAGTVYICTLPAKDPNEMLVNGQGEQLKWLVLTGAKKYQPDGIVNAKDLWEKYKSTEEVEYYPFPDSMPYLNQMLYGLKPGTVTTITGGTSIGKTQFMRELKYHYLTTTNLKIADIELEADTTETMKALVGLQLGKRITLPDVIVPEEQQHAAFESLFGSGRLTLYDYFGGMDDDNLFSKLRYFAATGSNLIFLDHLSIIVSEYAAAGGERERIDTIMTKLAKFAKETNIALVLVVHLKKSGSDGVSFEEGAIPDLDDLRGSASIKQLSWDIIGLSRNTQHPDRNCVMTTELTVLKCRLTGRTGQAGFLRFDDITGRYANVPMPPNYRMKI